jgi:hypothetical protein
MSEKRKPGRPKLPKGQAKGKYVPVRLNDDDMKLFTKAAKKNKQTLSEWIRSTLRQSVESE